MKNKKSVIPNFFTTLNIFCGFLAIISALDGKLVTASWLISLAAVLDLLDGQMARLVGGGSSFGVEFDSLADVISFGAAPSVLLFKLHFSSMGILGVVISFLPLFFGSVRLARFNVLYGGKEKTKFSGLPIPHAALNIAAFVIWNYHFWGQLQLSRILIPQLLVVCVLMVSTVEYYTMPKFTLRQSKKKLLGIALMFLAALILALYPQETFYPLSSIYIVWGVIRYVFRLVRG
ncbi:MAG: CDP-diacylglycerol--serine O-phosphatidyltransferase [candidate division KSB1 bacterium]|nr:CDP-diacylglycerol--serine O-phosphatidyltransferase [candidate division KSB1 bacterium]